MDSIYQLYTSAGGGQRRSEPQPDVESQSTIPPTPREAEITVVGPEEELHAEGGEEVEGAKEGQELIVATVGINPIV